MPKLLHVDSSPLYGHSVSRELTSTFVEHWKAAHPDSDVVERDLNATVIPPLTAEWVAAAFTPEIARTPEQTAALSLSDTLIAELQEADEYVIGVPMHNFSVSSALKLWIDQITRVDKTFSYATGTPRGLISGKKATFVIASGAFYDAGTQFASYNFVEPYLRALFGFMGVTEVVFLTVGGTTALNHGQDRAAFLESHIKAVAEHAKAA